MNTTQTTAPTATPMGNAKATRTPALPGAPRSARLGSLVAAALLTVAMLGSIDVLSVPAAGAGVLAQTTHAPAV